MTLRRLSKRLSYPFKRNHISIWKWIQKYQTRKISLRKEIEYQIIVDETLLKVGSDCLVCGYGLVAITEPENKLIHSLSVSKERNMLIAEDS